MQHFAGFYVIDVHPYAWFEIVCGQRVQQIVFELDHLFLVLEGLRVCGDFLAPSVRYEYLMHTVFEFVFVWSETCEGAKMV